MIGHDGALPCLRVRGLHVPTAEHSLALRVAPANLAGLLLLLLLLESRVGSHLVDKARVQIHAQPLSSIGLMAAHPDHLCDLLSGETHTGLVMTCLLLLSSLRVPSVVRMVEGADN